MNLLCSSILLFSIAETLFGALNVIIHAVWNDFGPGNSSNQLDRSSDFTKPHYKVDDSSPANRQPSFIWASFHSMVRRGIFGNRPIRPRTSVGRGLQTDSPSRPLLSDFDSWVMVNRPKEDSQQSLPPVRTLHRWLPRHQPRQRRHHHRQCLRRARHSPTPTLWYWVLLSTLSDGGNFYQLPWRLARWVCCLYLGQPWQKFWLSRVSLSSVLICVILIWRASFENESQADDVFLGMFVAEVCYWYKIAILVSIFMPSLWYWLSFEISYILTVGLVDWPYLDSFLWALSSFVYLYDGLVEWNDLIIPCMSKNCEDLSRTLGICLVDTPFGRLIEDWIIKRSTKDNRSKKSHSFGKRLRKRLEIMTIGSSREALVGNKRKYLVRWKCLLCNLVCFSRQLLDVALCLGRIPKVMRYDDLSFGYVGFLWCVMVSSAVIWCVWIMGLFLTKFSEMVARRGGRVGFLSPSSVPSLFSLFLSLHIGLSNMQDCSLENGLWSSPRKLARNLTKELSNIWWVGLYVCIFAFFIHCSDNVSATREVVNACFSMFCGGTCMVLVTLITFYVYELLASLRHSFNIGCAMSSNFASYLCCFFITDYLEWIANSLLSIFSLRYILGGFPSQNADWEFTPLKNWMTIGNWITWIFCLIRIDGFSSSRSTEHGPLYKITAYFRWKSMIVALLSKVRGLFGCYLMILSIDLECIFSKLMELDYMPWTETRWLIVEGIYPYDYDFSFVNHLDRIQYLGSLSCLHTWLCATMLMPNKYKVLSCVDRLIYWLSYQREKSCNSLFFSFVIFSWICMSLEKSNCVLCFYPLMRINCGASNRMLKEWDSIPRLSISMIQDQIQFLKSHFPYGEVQFLWDRTDRGIARNSRALSKILVYFDNGSRCCKVLRGRTLDDPSLYANKQVLTDYSAKYMFFGTFLGPGKAKRIYLVFDQIAPKWLNFL